MRALCIVVVGVLASVTGTDAAHAKLAWCTPPLTPDEVAANRATYRADIVPPATPVLHAVSLEHDRVHVQAQLDADTDFVEITIVDSTGHETTLWTTPDRLYVCAPAYLAVGEARVSVAAHDASGNVSSAQTTSTVMRQLRRYRCGIGVTMIFFVLAPIALLGLGIGLLLVFFLRRRALRLPGEPISPLVAEAIARSVLRRNLVALATGLGAIFAFHATEWYGTAVLVAVVPLAAFSRVIASHAILRAIERGERAELHHNLLAVDGRALPTSSRVVDAARQHAVPASIAREPNRFTSARRT
jgi:hypothetical protein